MRIKHVRNDGCAIKTSPGIISDMHTKREKERLRRFLAVKEIVMIGLVVMNVVLLVLEHFVPLTHEQLVAIEVFDAATALVFLAEFGFELYWAKDRGKYIRHHWFYLLAAIPVTTTLFEELRVVRLLRLLKLLKIFGHMRYERNTRLFEKSHFTR